MPYVGLVLQNSIAVLAALHQLSNPFLVRRCLCNLKLLDKQRRQPPLQLFAMSVHLSASTRHLAGAHDRAVTAVPTRPTARAHLRVLHKLHNVKDSVAEVLLPDRVVECSQKGHNIAYEAIKGHSADSTQGTAHHPVINLDRAKVCEGWKTPENLAAPLVGPL